MGLRSLGSSKLRAEGFQLLGSTKLTGVASAFKISSEDLKASPRGDLPAKLTRAALVLAKGAQERHICTRRPEDIESHAETFPRRPNQESDP